MTLTQEQINGLTTIPYKHNGNSVEEGFDCITFIIYYLNNYCGYELDINLPDYDFKWYKDNPDLYFIHVLNYCRLTKFNKNIKLEINDLIFFNHYEDSKITHAGVYIGDNKFIHCVYPRGVKVHKLSLFKDSISFIGKVVV